MTHAVLSKEMKSYLTSAKVFVSKSQTRPILTGVLVNELYIIATDAHRLIRINHNEYVQDAFIHQYKNDWDLSVSRYPDTSRLIPDQLDSKQTFIINVAEWLEAHTLGLVATKEHEKNYAINLKEKLLYVKPVTRKVIKGSKDDYSPMKGKNGYRDVAVPLHEQIAYNYTLDSNTHIENLSYNCKFMIEALKIFKKFKHTDVRIHFYSNTRPFLMVAGNIEIVILPIRNY